MNELQKAFLQVLIELDQIQEKHNIDYSLYGGSYLGAVRHKGFIPWDDDIDIVLDRTNYNNLIDILNQSEKLNSGYYLQTFENRKNYYNTTPKFRSSKHKVIEQVPKNFDQATGAWVDLFVFDNVPDTEAERIKLFKQLNRIDKILLTFVYAQADPKSGGLKNTVKKLLEKTNQVLHPLYFFIKPLIRRRNKLAQSFNHIETSHKGVNNYNFYTSYEEYKANMIEKENLTNYSNYQFEDQEFKGYNNYDHILTTFFGDYMTPLKPEDRIDHNITY
ncbi:MAG: LicD family protein [Erysipelothrix sp.]|nr:LicD family protein [Erysipelothrix sp.]